MLIRLERCILSRRLCQSHWSEPEAEPLAVCEEQQVKQVLTPTESGRGDLVHLCRETDGRRWTRRGLQMAGFLDNFRWPEWECIDWGERRNAVASIVAGVLVSSFIRVTVCVTVCKGEIMKITQLRHKWGYDWALTAGFHFWTNWQTFQYLQLINESDL